MAAATGGGQSNMMRMHTQYIKSPGQKKLAERQQGTENRQVAAAKNHFRQAEAQSLANGFRRSLEDCMDCSFDEWVVTDSLFDLVRKAILKVRVADEEYIHLYLVKVSKTEPWRCRYASFKSEEDELDQNEDNYDVLEKRSCLEEFDAMGCNHNLPTDCSVM
eukprot:TRINITY_DN27797_c0_g1_i1.p1 TRINITY_DN27797_c0_g1~~TRINITY_DN27797_c0_g1_i1.p1  ORF type:complete len:162 (+),score=51.84 TRINITY_DN27797_c0_g1_i1:160-645(+)